MNDKAAIELINRSLSEPLNDQEQADLQRHLVGSPQVQNYLQLGEQIQQSLDQHAASASPAGPGLSEIARNRIARRLATELSLLKADSGDERRVAEDHPGYQVGSDGQPSNETSDPSGS